MLQRIVSWCYANPRIFWSIVVIGAIGDFLFIYLCIRWIGRQARRFFSTRTLTLAISARCTAFPGAGKPPAFRQGVELRVNKHPLIVYFIDSFLQKFNFLYRLIDNLASRWCLKWRHRLCADTRSNGAQHVWTFKCLRFKGKSKRTGTRPGGINRGFACWWVSPL